MYFFFFSFRGCVYLTPKTHTSSPSVGYDLLPSLFFFFFAKSVFLASASGLSPLLL